MTIAKLLSISLCIGACSPGLAADPTPPAPVTTPASTNATSTSASATDKTKTDAPKTTDVVTPGQAKMFRSQGYKTEVRNGITYYCRKEAQLGTRFEKKVCGTSDEILRSTQDSQELVSTIQRNAIAPAPGNGH
jgi:hypothetical protein